MRIKVVTHADIVGFDVVVDVADRMELFEDAQQLNAYLVYFFD